MGTSQPSAPSNAVTVSQPITGTILINNNATTTNNANATLTMSWAGGGGTGVKNMRFSDDGSNWTAWQTAAKTAAHVLPAPDGVKTVWVQFRDSQGNSSPAFSDSILLDTAPPTGTFLINNNAANTKTPAVTLNLTYTDGTGTGVTSMRFSNAGSAWSAWRTAAATASFTLSAPDGVKTVQVQFRDLAGNVSAVYTGSIVLDTTLPTGTIVINNNAPTTTTLAVTLNLTYTDGTGTGVTNMRFSDNGTTWTAWEPVKTTRAYTLPAGLGLHRVRVQYSDAAGNLSFIYSGYIQVI
jgi:ribosomal protein S11